MQKRNRTLKTTTNGRIFNSKLGNLSCSWLPDSNALDLLKKCILQVNRFWMAGMMAPVLFV
jgi:hypothetical protein